MPVEEPSTASIATNAGVWDLRLVWLDQSVFIWSIVGTFRAPARWPCTMAKPVVISLLAVLATGPAVAKDLYPISVPGECYELAQREGVPAVISNRYEAAKAKVKLARLRDTDPMVHECRQAVNRSRQSIIQASE